MKNDTTISRDNAVADLNKWFDAIGVPEDLRLDIDLGDDIDTEEDRVKKREKDDVMRERVLRAMMKGNLLFNEETNQLEYTLSDPVTKKDSGEPILTKLIFKNRYKAHELEGNMKGVKPDEFMPMMRAYISTLTGVSRSIIGQMWNNDTDVAQAIYTLFTRGEA